MDINSFLSQPLTANTYKSKSEDFVKMLIQIVNEIRSGISEDMKLVISQSVGNSELICLSIRPLSSDFVLLRGYQLGTASCVLLHLNQICLALSVVPKDEAAQTSDSSSSAEPVPLGFQVL